MLTDENACTLAQCSSLQTLQPWLLSEGQAHHPSLRRPVLLFSKLNKMFFGYFDPEKIFLDNENTNFRGELTDISTKNEALTASSSRMIDLLLWCCHLTQTRS